MEIGASPVESPASPGPGSASGTTITVPSTTSMGSGTSNLIHFSTIRDLIQAIESAPGDILRADNVSPEVFALLAAREKRGFRLRRYYAALQLLIVTIPTGLHERAHLPIYDEITMAIYSMGLKSEWSSNGATTYVSPNGDGGEGDSSGAPWKQRRGPNAWPTLVIESGYSESLQALRNDMRWWFSASNHQVKIVILAKLDTTQRLIILEKYREVQAGQRSGATMTRAASALEPRLDQAIRISQAGNSIDLTDPSSFVVTRGDLRLEFSLLFLRQPGPGEHDVVIGMQDLQLIAAKIWG